VNDPACLYALLESPARDHDTIVRELVGPLAQRWRAAPALDSLFFVRYSEPAWQLRFRVLGDPDWLAREVRPAIARALAAPALAGRIERVTFATYEREYDRYGGPAGMRLCEQLFHLDSLACLDWLALESAGATAWTRREFALVLVERYADALGLDASARSEFDRQAYQWAFDQGVWDEAHRVTLEQAFERNRPGLEALLGADPPASGSAAEHAILHAFVGSAAPVCAALRRGLDAGEIPVHRPYLAWSLAHMFTNRMGIPPAAEAILRYMAHRRYVAPAPHRP